MHTISNEKIYQISVPTPFIIGDANLYLIVGDVLTLVDVGVKTKEAWLSFKHQLKRLGYEPEDIEQIVLTHHHPDHTGLINHFPKVKRIIGHQDCKAWLQKDVAHLHDYSQFLTSYYTKHGVPSNFQHKLTTLHQIFIDYGGNGKLTYPIDEGNTLPGLESWVVIETKGHAQTHLSFYREADGLCISGDHLLEQVVPTPFIEKPYQIESNGRASPFIQFRENLIKCKRLNMRKNLPGHGLPFIDVSQVITKYLNNQNKYFDRVLANLTDKSNAYQLSQILFPNQGINEIEITMSMTIGYLDYLELQGDVYKTKSKGIWYYSRTGE